MANDLRALRAAADRWRVHSEGRCPTVDDLARDRAVAANVSLDDSWGHRYLVRCSEDETDITSAGPDGRFETADDIVAPKQ